MTTIATPVARVHRARMRVSVARVRRYAIGTGAILSALIVWQLLTTTGAIDKQWISTPLETGSAIGTMASSGQLGSNGLTSFIAFVIGYGISLAIGIPLGMAMGWYKLVRRFVEPPAMVALVTPRLALVPVIIVWLGIGLRSTVVVIVIGAAVPVMINAMAGVRDVDPKLVQVAESLQATRFDLFRKILLPSAMPMILSGARLAVAAAVFGVVISEMYVSTPGGGVGDLITSYGLQFNTPYIVGVVLIIAVFGWLVTACVRRLENHFDSWRQR
jgi:NitT/TauT family transport system permease protein